MSVLGIASFVSMSSLLLQLHLTRENEPEVPAFVMGRRVWEVFVEGVAGLEVRPAGRPPAVPLGAGEL